MRREALPEISEGNADIWQLLMILNNQWLCGFNGVYGFNMQTAIEAARELDIALDLEFFLKVKAFETEALKHTGGSAGCTKEKKDKCREMFGSNLEWACEHCEEKQDG